MTESSATPAVRHAADRRRFEADVAGGIAFAEYEMQGDAMVFTHTVVPEESEGQGIGTRLVEAGLAHARAEGHRVVPQCPFVAAYIERHPEAA